MTLPPEGTPAARAVLQKRYAAIELAYSDQNWEQSESLNQALLAELPDTPGDPLRQRLLLLLGHTRLYGKGDTAAAKQYYGSVLQQSEEATLREIAQQGLEQCLALEQPAPAATVEGNAATPWLQGDGDTETGATRRSTAPAVAGGAAAPWLQRAATGDTSPEAIAPGSTAAPDSTAATSGIDNNNADPGAVTAASSAPVEPVVETAAAAAADPTATAATPAAAAVGAPTPQQPLAGEETSLTVEIVEEPEQIAVAQADPRRREELDLQEPLLIGTAALSTAQASEPEPPAAREEELSEELLQEFSRNLLRLRLG